MADKKTDYQTLNSELDEILSRLQSDDTDVDEAVRLYERGMAVAREIEGKLSDSENKITKIKSDWESRNNK